MIAMGRGEGVGNSNRGAVGVKDSIGKTSEPRVVKSREKSAASLRSSGQAEGGRYKEVAIMPIAAADMTTNVIQPR
jgi:hypothetical protein